MTTDSSPLAQPDAMAQYQRVLRRRLLWIGVLLLAILASLLLDFTLGPAGLSLETLWHALREPASVDAGTRIIVWDIRLPYALMAMVVGAALGLAGAEMQTILNNPLASPFTLGVSSAAAFGAALAIVLGIGIPGIADQWFISANAFVFALFAALMLDGISRWTQVSSSGVVLFGIALVFTFNALVSMMQFIATEDTLQGLVFWTMGSLARILGQARRAQRRAAGAAALLAAQQLEADRTKARGRSGGEFWHRRAPSAADHPAAHQHSVGAGGGVCRTYRLYRPGRPAHRPPDVW